MTNSIAAIDRLLTAFYQIKRNDSMRILWANLWQRTQSGIQFNSIPITINHRLKSRIYSLSFTWYRWNSTVLWRHFIRRNSNYVNRHGWTSMSLSLIVSHRFDRKPFAIDKMACWNGFAFKSKTLLPLEGELAFYLERIWQTAAIAFVVNIVTWSGLCVSILRLRNDHTESLEVDLNGFFMNYKI